jgi:hypothetical protein
MWRWATTCVVERCAEDCWTNKPLSAARVAVAVSPESRRGTADADIAPTADTLLKAAGRLRMRQWPARRRAAELARAAGAGEPDRSALAMSARGLS